MSDTPRAASPGWRLASLNHTRNGDRFITWWRPRNADYTDDLDAAGCYELEQLQREPSYYGNPEVLCVPDHVARRLAVGPHVRNPARAWAALRLASLFTHVSPYPIPTVKRRRPRRALTDALTDALDVARQLEALASATGTYELVWACIASRRVLEDLPLGRQAVEGLARFLRDELYSWARIHGLAPIVGGGFP